MLHWHNRTHTLHFMAQQTIKHWDTESGAGQALPVLQCGEYQCLLFSIPDQPFVLYGMGTVGHGLNADPQS